MRVRVNGAWEDIDSGLVRVGNAWKRLASIRVYVGGAWKEGKVFVPPLSLSITPDTASAVRTGPGTATTGSVTATPAGGQTPFTYAWTRISGVGTIGSPTSATTAFSQTLGIGDDVSGTFRCTVTDSVGSTATSDIVANFTEVS